jgi:glycosyltransferase involved in cell wall biosynthesis
MRAMRVLVLDQFSDPGGAQFCIRDLALEVVRRGWSATFLAPGNGGIHAELEQIGFCSRQIPSFDYANGRKTWFDVTRYGPDLARAATTVRSLAKTNRPDLVYINGPRLLPLAFAFDCPTVFHAHSYLNKTYARAIAAACIRARRIQVIAASRFAAGALEGWIDSRSVRVIYSGVADMGFAAKPLRAPVRIAMIGRVAPEKGQLDFVRAARILSHRISGVEFAVYGSQMFSQAGYEQQVCREAIGLPIRFAGWTADVAHALHEIDVLAVPSSAIEAAGRVVMQAFSAGAPVVAYPSGGIPELIQHEYSGLLTENHSPESLARNLEKLIADPRLAIRIAKNGRQEWERRFRVERFQSDVCNLLLRLQRKAPGARFALSRECSPEQSRQIEPSLTVTGEDNLV